MKVGAVEIFEDTKFTFHKSHSNAPELESEQPSVGTENTFAKQQLSPAINQEFSLLGLPWNTDADEFTVMVPEMKTPVTKRELLDSQASIYDPLGLTAPVTLTGKRIYQETYEAKTAWDASVPESKVTEYSRRVKGLPKCATMPRALTTQRAAMDESNSTRLQMQVRKGFARPLYDRKARRKFLTLAY